MSIADKLTAIAENQQKVFDAGQKAMHSLWLNQAITELNEPSMTAVWDYQFYSFSKLERAIFQNATTAGTQAFRNCRSLYDVSLPRLESVNEALLRATHVSRLDVPYVTSIAASAFAYTTTFTALILRGDTVCTLANTNAFTNTKIANGTGYIYVPAVLLQEYKAATNWSTYAGQIRAIEDYPNLDGTGVVITEQPTDLILPANTQGVLSVTAEGDDLKYAWYLDMNDGNGFVASTYSGYNAATQTMWVMNSRVGWRFYCEIIDAYGHMVRTNIVTMGVAE